MKSLRLLLLTTMMVSFSLVAAADGIPDIHIILDPIPPSDPGVVLTDILSTGTAVSAPWQSCSLGGIPNSVSGETACLALVNLTGQSISSVSVSFTVPSSLAGQTIGCASTDNFLTSNNCALAGTLTTGELVDVTFSGGTPVPNNTAIFFGSDAPGLPGPDDFPPITLTAAADTPEPGGLLLVSTGLLLFGLGWVRRRRGPAAIGTP